MGNTGVELTHVQAQTINISGVTVGLDEEKLLPPSSVESLRMFRLEKAFRRRRCRLCFSGLVKRVFLRPISRRDSPWLRRN